MNEQIPGDRIDKLVAQDPIEPVVSGAEPVVHPRDSVVRYGGVAAISAARPDMRPLQPPSLEVAIASMGEMHIVGPRTAGQQKMQPAL